MCNEWNVRSVQRGRRFDEGKGLPLFEELKFLPGPFHRLEAREEVLNRATRHGNLGSAFTRKLGLLGASSVQKNTRAAASRLSLDVHKASRYARACFFMNY